MNEQLQLSHRVYLFTITSFQTSSKLKKQIIANLKNKTNKIKKSKMDICTRKNKNLALNKLTSYMEKNETTMPQMKWKKRISFYKMNNVSLFLNYNL